jgi:hypothetical protein
VTPREWLDREIAGERLPARPPDEALCLAAGLIRPAAETTKTPSLQLDVLNDGGRTNASASG